MFRPDLMHHPKNLKYYREERHEPAAEDIRARQYDHGPGL